MTTMDKIEVKKLGFMAILTLFLIGTTQIASMVGLALGRLTFQEYLMAWVPIVSMATGFWFGRQEEKEE